MASTPPPSKDQPRLRGRTALEDTLGPWLNGNHQAEVAQLRNRLAEEIQRATTFQTESALYSDFWRQSMTDAERIANGFEVALMGRERLIGLLLYFAIKGSLNYDMSEADTQQLNICMAYSDELRAFAADNYNYDCQLQPSEYVINRAIEDVAADDLIDLTTDEDSDDDVIDLVSDTDDED